MPDDFVLRVASKTFTNSADVPSVCQLQKRVATKVLAKVEILHFNRFGWGVAEIRQLCNAMPLCESLIDLSLYSNALGPEGAELLAAQVAAGHLRKLESLVLSKTAISDAGVKALSAALVKTGPTRLLELLLGNNGLGGAGALAVADAIKGGALPALEKLALDRNSFGDDAFGALAASLSSVPKLAKLLMTGNRPPEGEQMKGVQSLRGAALQHGLAFMYSTVKSSAAAAAAPSALAPAALPLLLGRIEAAASRKAIGVEEAAVAHGTEEHKAVCALCELADEAAGAVVIRRIDNPTTAARFEAYLPAHAETAEETEVSFMLHGTDQPRVASIFAEGFRLPTTVDADGNFTAGTNAAMQAGYEKLMFGGAIYLTSSREKAESFSPHRMLLVCAAKLGKRLQVVEGGAIEISSSGAEGWALTPTKVHAMKVDSIFCAPRGRLEADEAALYCPEAVLPLYTVDVSAL